MVFALDEALRCKFSFSIFLVCFLFYLLMDRYSMVLTPRDDGSKTNVFFLWRISDAETKNNPEEKAPFNVSLSLLPPHCFPVFIVSPSLHTLPVT